MPHPKQHYYFDTNALWKYYRLSQTYPVENDVPPLNIEEKKEKGCLVIRRLVSNSLTSVLVSQLTILEMIGRLMRSRRQRHLKQKGLNKVVKRLRQDICLEEKAHHFRLCSISADDFRLAESILLQYAYHFSISSYDALHLAIVQKLHSYDLTVTMVTSDNSLKRVCEKTGVAFYDPEQAYI